jgi:hypothetical protein
MFDIALQKRSAAPVVTRPKAERNVALRKIVKQTHREASSNKGSVSSMLGAFGLKMGSS